MDAVYNDIQPWNNKDLLSVFGADPQKSKTFQVKTIKALHDLFDDEEFSAANYIQVCRPFETVCHQPLLETAARKC